MKKLRFDYKYWFEMLWIVSFGAVVGVSLAKIVLYVVSN
jgi:hypothetical protein